jgi:peptide/nickel transport system permease protein
LAGYIFKRIGWTIVVLWATVTLTFGATFVSPIDPARSYAGPRATNQVIAQVRKDFGLDRPIYIQYGRYLWRILHGDLGNSYTAEKSVRQAVLDRLPNTGLLALGALIVQIALGVPLGLLAAMKHGSVIDRSILLFSLVGVAIPSFVLGFLLLYFFAFKLAWFPLGGSGSFRQLILPATTVGIAGAAWYARMLRSTALNILTEDYIRMARAKGMPERVVVLRHVLRNAIGPIVTMIGLDVGVFLGGVLVIERVFAWPGVGGLTWQASTFNDVPLVMGTVLFAAFFVTIFNLIADLVNVAIDPRVSYV